MPVVGVGRRVGRHWPGPVPTGQAPSPNAPSFCRALIIAAAVWLPTEIPRRFALPSGTAASHWSYCVCSRACWAGNRELSTWKAAVPTAAFTDSRPLVPGAIRYGW